MFFDPFSQGSARFPYVGAGVVDVSALVFVYYSCLVCFGVLVLGVAQSCSKGVGPLEVDLDTSSFAKFLELVCYVGDVGDHYGGFVAGVVGWIGVSVGVVGSWCVVGMVELMLPLVECQGRELAVVEGCFNM